MPACPKAMTRPTSCRSVRCVPPAAAASLRRPRQAAVGIARAAPPARPPARRRGLEAGPPVALAEGRAAHYERIAAAGAGFRSLTEDIDTTTPAGRMMMQMVASFAEFERAMIRERTSAGLAAARAEGRVGGRRKKLDAAKRREIAESVITGRKTGAVMARLDHH